LQVTLIGGKVMLASVATRMLRAERLPVSGPRFVAG
jgi:hypothetical protein